MDSPASSPQRRFQFRLRTLMIGVTLFCVVVGGYVGAQAKIVRERKAMVREVTEMGGHVTFASEITKFGPDVSYQIGETKVKTPYPAVSPLRVWLGDDSALGIALPQYTPPSTVARLQSAFPEAVIDVRKGPLLRTSP